MKSTYIWIAIVVVIILGAGLWWFTSAKSAQTTTTQTPAVTTSDNSTTTTAIPTTAASAPAATSQSFKVNGNDATTDLKTITVAKGTNVSITFGADAGTTYHGGLDFRSSVISTGTITPGSTKTITFVADKSFSFTPYWPATNIAKPYTINVIVQ